MEIYKRRRPHTSWLSLSLVQLEGKRFFLGRDRARHARSRSTARVEIKRAPAACHYQRSKPTSSPAKTLSMIHCIRCCFRPREARLASAHGRRRDVGVDRRLRSLDVVGRGLALVVGKEGRRRRRIAELDELDVLVAVGLLFFPLPAFRCRLRNSRFLLSVAVFDVVVVTIVFIISCFSSLLSFRFLLFLLPLRHRRRQRQQ